MSAAEIIKSDIGIVFVLFSSVLCNLRCGKTLFSISSFFEKFNTSLLFEKQQAHQFDLNVEHYLLQFPIVFFH